MASGPFSQGLLELNKGNIKYDSNTIKAILVTRAVSLADRKSDSFDLIGDVERDGADPEWEAEHDGVNSQAITLTNLVTEDTADSAVHVGSSDVLTFDTVASGEVCTGIIIHKANGTASEQKNLFFCEFAETVTADGGPMTVTLHADGYGSFTFS